MYSFYNIAASNGHLECLKYAHENRCKYIECICEDGAWHDHVDCLEYVSKTHPIQLRRCTYAARNGHSECLDMLIKHIMKLYRILKTYEISSRPAHLAYLKYAYENGYQWDEHTCNSAAWNLQVESKRNMSRYCQKLAYNVLNMQMTMEVNGMKKQVYMEPEIVIYILYNIPVKMFIHGMTNGHGMEEYVI